MSVTVSFEGFVNWTGVREATFEKFGKGYKHNRYMEEYGWFGETTGITLKYREVLKKGQLWMSSRKLAEEAKAYDQRKAKEGASTGF